jgi:roadblock/LC7 domain-containing protein
MKDSICAELVARCFAARTAMHMAHLLASSYAAHMALGDFYDDIASAADKFAECHMGIEGKFTGFPAIAVDQTLTPIEYLPKLHGWIENNRTACADGSTELANIIDEILAVIDRTFYKLKFLK